MCILFIDALFDKLFKGRNITIKIKEMKYIIKTLLFDDNIKKYMNFFDILNKLFNTSQQDKSDSLSIFLLFVKISNIISSAFNFDFNNSDNSFWPFSAFNIFLRDKKS